MAHLQTGKLELELDSKDPAGGIDAEPLEMINEYKRQIEEAIEAQEQANATIAHLQNILAIAERQSSTKGDEELRQKCEYLEDTIKDMTDADQRKQFLHDTLIELSDNIESTLHRAPLTQQPGLLKLSQIFDTLQQLRKHSDNDQETIRSLKAQRALTVEIIHRDTEIKEKLLATTHLSNYQHMQLEQSRTRIYHLEARLDFERNKRYSAEEELQKANAHCEAAVIRAEQSEQLLLGAKTRIAELDTQFRILQGEYNTERQKRLTAEEQLQLLEREITTSDQAKIQPDRDFNTIVERQVEWRKSEAKLMKEGEERQAKLDTAVATIERLEEEARRQRQITDGQLAVATNEKEAAVHRDCIQQHVIRGLQNKIKTLLEATNHLADPSALNRTIEFLRKDLADAVHQRGLYAHSYSSAADADADLDLDIRERLRNYLSETKECVESGSKLRTKLPIFRIASLMSQLNRLAKAIVSARRTGNWAEAKRIRGEVVDSGIMEPDPKLGRSYRHEAALLGYYCALVDANANSDIANARRMIDAADALFVRDADGTPIIALSQRGEHQRKFGRFVRNEVDKHEEQKMLLGAVPAISAVQTGMTGVSSGQCGCQYKAKPCAQHAESKCGCRSFHFMVACDGHSERLENQDTIVVTNDAVEESNCAVAPLTSRRHY